jgi:hypothetical protein
MGVGWKTVVVNGVEADSIERLWNGPNTGTEVELNMEGSWTASRTSTLT